MKLLKSLAVVAIGLNCHFLVAQPTNPAAAPPLKPQISPAALPPTKASSPSTEADWKQLLARLAMLEKQTTQTTATIASELAPKKEDTHLLFKDAVEANNKTVDKVASVFQGFGWWIGILASIVSLGAGVVGWFAFKSLRDFNDEYRKRIARADAQWRAEWEDFRDKAVKELEKIRTQAKEQADDAEKSARRAGQHESEIDSTRAVLEKALTDIDQLQAKLRTKLGEETAPPGPEVAITTEASGPAPLGDALSREDTDEVKERLKGKLGNGEKRAGTL